MGKPVTFFEDEFLEAMLPLMPMDFRRDYARKKRAEKLATAKKAPKTAGAAKKHQKRGGGTLTTDASMNKLIALATQAETGLTRQQSATASQLARQGSQTHQWQFKTDTGAWANYSPAASKEVEKAYASWRVNPHVDVRAVHSGAWQYMVDFNLNRQQNIQHPEHKTRDIRRVSLV